MTQQHAVIIGGTRGIGLAMSRTLATRGIRLTVLGRNNAIGLNGKSIHFVQGNLQNPEDAVGRLRAAISIQGPIDSLLFFQRFRGRGEAWSGELQVSLTATKSIVEGLVDQFARPDDGSIVFVGSAAGSLVSQSASLAYHVAKAGLVQMARYYAVLLGPRGIRVNVVSPWAVLKDESKSYYESHEKLLKMYHDITPLRRMGKAEEVVSVIDFLCSRGASFVTGQEICVDGGLGLQSHESVARHLLEIK